MIRREVWHPILNTTLAKKNSRGPAKRTSCRAERPERAMAAGVRGRTGCLAMSRGPRSPTTSNVMKLIGTGAS